MEPVRILRIWAPRVLLVTVTVGSLWILAREIQRRYQIRREARTLQGEIDALTQRRDSLQTLLKYLNTPEAQDREARAQLGLQRPGEQVVVFPPGFEARPDATSDASGVRDQGSAPGRLGSEGNASNPTRWWRYFFGLRTENGSNAD